MGQAKKKGESISKQEYIKCYHSAETSTSGENTTEEEKTKKETSNKDLIIKALEIALDTRKFEIELYWKRTGYFVLFISAVFIGYYKIIQTKDSIIGIYQKEWLLLFLAALGFLLSLLWYMANRGSKFWQENWEAHIEQLSMYSGIPIFGIIKRREHSIRNLMQEYPFSVSKVNQMVSLIITISWFLTFIKDSLIFNENDKQIIKKVIANCSFLDTILFFLQNNILWRIIIIIIFLIIIISLGFVICRLCKGFAAKEIDKEDNINYFWNYSSELKLDNTSNDNDEDQN